MLKKIELTGFKSFSKKTELTFTTPVTAVVGPNGSGKSNIVESIRFVLGEQSNKSLRSKIGADLIYKGSKSLAQQNRAFVKIVFDNSKKSFRLGENNSVLDYDEIEIAREIFRDGGSRYLLNGSEVRLKDITELLSSIHIGASGHHIISQGEADRILSANPQERREMIEDALGLKIYQYRLHESERKLEKTEINMKEVEALRREIAPHLRYLKKQMDKIEYAKELGVTLVELYKVYLSTEQTYLLHTKEEIAKQKRLYTEQSKVLREKMAHVKFNIEIDELTPIRQVLEKTEHALLELRTLRSQSERALARFETLLEVEKSKTQTQQKEKNSSIVINRSHFVSFKETLETLIAETSASQDLETFRLNVNTIRKHFEGFTSKYLNTEESMLLAQVETEDKDEQKKLESDIADARLQVEKLVSKEHALLQEKAELEKKIQKSQDTRVLEERAGFELRVEEQTLLGHQRVLEAQENELIHVESLFQEEIREGSALVGRDVMLFTEENASHSMEFVDRHTQENRRKEIERIKIKLEEAGMGGGVDVVKEHEEVLERDRFLEKELTDLSESIEKIKEIICELRDTVDREFSIGIEKINTVFQEFFAIMFGGGKASLVVSVPQARRKNKDEEMFDDIDVEEKKEDGINIDVSLPHKKVKELMMLSGGERSLTSIALLFAMSQVNPPPFLVLDETDAALDEANSRRYGDMIEKLSQFSQLIVVTHNRETMSRAQVLYGVTLGSDSASKLLSVKLEEAVSIAK